MRRVLAVLVGVASSFALCLGLAGGADAAPKSDPDNVKGLSQFMEVVGKGNDLYAAKDYAGAIDTYKKASQLSPRNPLGPYLLGEGYLAMNNLPEAEAAFVAAAEINDAKTPPLIRSHVLFALADCYEREKKIEPARAAWQAYTEQASKLGAEAGAHPLSGVARLKALDDWLKLDQQYALVRQRIAAEKADASAKK
jgi:tetratricopeptide (TPR) repeat protein